MRPFNHPPGAFVNNAAGLAIATAAGALFSTLDTPIPWLLGPLLVVAAINVAGWRIGCPPGTRQVGQILIGTMIGLYFTSAIALIVLVQLPWMILVAVISIMLGGLAAVILVRYAGLDGPTAFFGSVPGGMAEMLTIGERFRAETTTMALIQLTRVTIVVITIPAALTWYGETGTAIFTPLSSVVSPWGLAVLLGGTTAAALALNALGVTNAWMLGACAFAAALTLSGIDLSAMPRSLLMAAQVLIGCSVGQRFEREAMARAPRVVLGSTALTLIMIAITVGLAALIAGRTELSLSSMAAATAPGGLAEMSITAQILGLSVPLVTAYHVVRVFLITVFTLPIYRLATRVASPRV